MNLNDRLAKFRKLLSLGQRFPKTNLSLDGCSESRATSLVPPTKGRCGIQLRLSAAGIQLAFA